MKRELEYLKQYKLAQKELFEQAIQGYQKDKVIRLQEATLREQDFEESVKALGERLGQREQESDEISKNYFQYKHSVQRAKDRLKDDKELLLIEQRALEDQLAKLKEKSFNDKEYSVDLYAKKAENFAQRFRKLTQANENDLKVIKNQYG